MMHLDLEQALACARGTGDPRSRTHLVDCSDCREEVSTWQATRNATLAFASETAAPSIVERALSEIASPNSGYGAAARLGWCATLVRTQVVLAGRALWPASAVMFLLGVAVTVASAHSESTARLMILVAPVAAVLACGMATGSDSDEAWEIVRATQTSPRLILLARMLVICGIDVVLGVVLSAYTAGRTSVPWTAIVSGWLGPMLVLSALALLLTVLAGSTVGITTSLAVWSVRAFAGLPAAGSVLGGDELTYIREAWTTDGRTLGVTAALLILALMIGPRRVMQS